MQPAAAAAAHQLVIREDQRKQNNVWQCVLTSGGVSCVMTVTRLALHPPEHEETLDIVDDRVHEEGALRPRLVPLRVHEGAVHAPAQELLVEQHAVGELHCGSNQSNWRLVFSVVHLLASTISVCHRSCFKK